MGTTLRINSMMSLAPYAGEWTAKEAAHLLRRTGFGLRPEELDQLSGMDLSSAVDLLLEDRPLPDPPINYDYLLDPNVPLGRPWPGKPLAAGVNLNTYRNRSLRAWVMDNIRKERLSARERMVEFWSNHFAIAGGGQAQVRYDNHMLLETFAFGNFRELIKRVVVDKAMLVFLNGNQNFVASPNENFARELLELFTVGKGPQIGDGDYSNYTEEDVRALARALTGWRTRYLYSTVPGQEPEVYFQANLHDTSDKQLSYHFNNDIITDAGEEEYKHVVDRIFQQPATALYICRKLYRHFVYYKIPDQVETDIIVPMARILTQNDFEIRPVLRALFMSQHFYNADNLGPMIKNPLQLVAGLMRTFNHDHQLADFNFDQERRTLNYYYARATLMDMEYFNPPSVAGWEAYYQEPSFYRIWINGSTLQERTRFTRTMTGINGFGVGDGVRATYDYLAWIAQIPNATEPNALITGIVERLLPRPLSAGQLANLKETLIPGLPDFEWTVEYGDHLANPNDEDLAASVAAKLRDLFRAVFSLAEFQLV
ncbi:DUF1800 domain-containing protein [Neolewinella agarilytica]|uniref:DUF1800 domain-containing protein n=1 Tax=Neolewinella agarilytica TaxID=478744 RepID=A0A1H9M0A6_9BACT|nr:DUF1800 domain-containing protein [Neolewinella agarilytica]SER17019.1 Protein of unknown function [Neolewinella agarilytica]